MEQFLDKLPDLLSPAGSPDALVAAVYSGTNAVYLGLDKFNARMKADNFTQENLAYWVNFCHLFDVKVYVTINTSIKNSEFEQACELGVFCYKNNVDGLIVTDIGLLKFFTQNFPEFDVTLSTQQNIHNVAGAKIAKELGCKRVVLSRETPLTDVEKIKNSVEVEIETFLHGALCVSLSGQCLFSSYIDGNSGNRGFCAQPCRQKYICTINGKEINNAYLLSTKDLCLARNLAKLSYAGIGMLKIEGRNRRPQYVAQTTSTYRKILTNNFEVQDSDLDDLKKIYNRGNFTNGYLNNNANIIYSQAQGHIGTKVGELAKLKNEWIVKSNIYLHDGDAFKIFRNSVEVGSAYCLKSSNGGHAKLNVKGDCKIGDEVNITTSIAQISQLDSITKSISISAKFEGKIGQKAKLTLQHNDTSIFIETEENLEKAQKQPLTKENIIQQLNKTGNTNFTILSIDIDIDEIFMPISTLNALRRSAIEKLQEKIIEKYNKKLSRINDINPVVNNFKTINTPSREKICLYVENIKNLPDSLKETIIIYKPQDYNLSCVNDSNLNNISQPKFLDLPNFATESDYAVLKSILKKGVFEGVVANNLYAIYLARELNLKIILGLGMNIFNIKSLVALSNLCEQQYYGYFYSQELTTIEINDFGDDNGFIFTDGEICLMTLAHCPLHVNLKADCGKCPYDGQTIYYIDKTGRQFQLKRKRMAKCYWELYNCLPLCGSSKVKSTAKFLLKPSKDRIKEVYNFYSNFINNPQSTLNEPPHTTGHLTKKIK